MKRRAFNKLSGALVLAGVLPACDPPKEETPAMTLPPFAPARFQSRLEALRLAFEAKRMHVSASLQPPVSGDQLRDRCKWFPSPLPEELVALYGWHDGQPNDAMEEEFPFWFRDCGFSCLKNAELGYAQMMDSYGRNREDHELLKHSFPFAAFEGAWLVLTCKNKHPRSPYQHSVVSVFQGVELSFYSMETMVETCIDWVSHAKYGSGNSDLGDAEELAIWNKHNPGIFK